MGVCTLLDLKGLRNCVHSSVNVDLYGCDTWSLTLKEGHMPRVFERGCCGGYLSQRGRGKMGVEKTT